MRMNWKWATTTGLGAIAFTVTSGGASAFFPPIVPTPDPVTITVPPPVAPILVPPVVRPPILVEPVVPLPPVVVPPVPPPPFVPPVSPPNVPQSVPPTCVCVPNVPQTVPEPTTIVSGLIGLAAVAGNAVRRRRADHPKA